jgi:hypothetical protein
LGFKTLLVCPGLSRVTQLQLRNMEDLVTLRVVSPGEGWVFDQALQKMPDMTPTTTGLISL